MEALKRFDQTFGVAGPECNCDSIGRSAGCDDCSENIKLREEHRSFLAAEILEERRETIRSIVESIKEIESSEENDADNYGYTPFPEIYKLLNQTRE